MPSDNTVDLESIKSYVGQVLSIPESLWSYWDIIDYYPADEPELALAHYSDKEYDPDNRAHEPLRKIRGTIVDLKTGAIVADSYGYTQTLPAFAPLEEFKSADVPHGVIRLQTNVAFYLNRFEDAPEEPIKFKEGIREFDQKVTRLCLGYEGVLIRIFKWKDEIFFSTHRRINGYKSNWGGRGAFYEIYKKLGGPDPETELFGDEPYSPYCHQFLVIDNEIRLATSTRDNRILYLGAKKVWDEETYAGESGPYAWPTEIELNLPHFREDEEPDVFSRELDRAMFMQPSVDVAMANKFIFPHQHAPRVPEGADEYGAKENELIIDYTNDGQVNEIYFNPTTEQILDERLSGGDFLIMYTQTPEGETIVYRLEPAAFEFRVGVTGNDPNMYHRFVVEMVNFTKGESSDLLNKFPRLVDTTGQIRLDNPEGRQIYWWSLFYESVAPAFKEEVENYLSKYHADIRKVAAFINTEYPKVKDEEELKRITQATHRRFTELRQIAHDLSIREKRSPYGALVGLLYKETGASLYKMISTVRNILRLREQNK